MLSSIKALALMCGTASVGVFFSSGVAFDLTLLRVDKNVITFIS